MNSGIRSHGRNGVTPIRGGQTVRVIRGAHRVSGKVVKVIVSKKRLILDVTVALNNRRLSVHANNVIKA